MTITKTIERLSPRSRRLREEGWIIHFIEAIGDNPAPFIRISIPMLKHLSQDGRCLAFCDESAICSSPTSRWLARVVSHLSYRIPCLNIFKLEAGIGATTSAIF